MDDFGVDLDEIARVIERADVLVMRFQVIEKRLLVDFRTSEAEGPLIKAVPPASSVEERFRSLKELRPGFPLPERILSFMWPRGLGSFQEAGLLDMLQKRLISVGSEAVDGAVRESYAELLAEERETVRAAIRGGEGFQTIWERGT